MPHSKSSDSLRRQSILALLMTPLLVMVGLHAIAVRAMAVLANVAIAVLANVAFEVLANVAIAILALVVGVAIAILARVLVVAIADVVHHHVVRECGPACWSQMAIAVPLVQDCHRPKDQQ